MLHLIRASFVKAFSKKYLFITNILAGSALLGLGDGIEQTIERKRRIRNKHDWKRTCNMITMGATFGFLAHNWYRILDKRFRGNTTSAVTKKVLLDQIVGSPVGYTIFIFGYNALDGVGYSRSKEEFIDKFPTLYIADWCVWPLAQAINFKYINARYRAVYVNTLTLGWNVFLSYIKYEDQPADEEPPCTETSQRAVL